MKEKIIEAVYEIAADERDFPDNVRREVSATAMNFIGKYGIPYDQKEKIEDMLRGLLSTTDRDSFLQGFQICAKIMSGKLFCEESSCY